MTRCLITGITGFVGSHLADYLLEHTDWDIYGLCRWRSPLDNISHLLPEINSGGRIKLVYGELRDSDSINEVVKASQPDYVFHLAAQSYPKTSFTSALDTYDTNINGTHRVLEALRQYKKDAIIHVCSSSEVYGRVPKEKTPIMEDCNFHPASPYAISKVGTDLIGRHYAEAYGMTVMVTRMFTHTGPRRGDVFAESSFAKQIAMIESGQIDPVIKGGNLYSTRTYADVRDAVRAYHMLLTVNPKAGEVYNIGGNYTCSIEEMLQYLTSLSAKRFARLPLRFEVDKDRLRPIDADNQVPCVEKFVHHTGWKPEIHFTQTMQDLLEYWRKRAMSGERFLTR
jgi:GDPmannose 4,6-dehydratase